MLYIVLKVSSTCSHTRLKSLSPLSNCFINYALVNLKTAEIQFLKFK